jgi:2-oxoacid:acceptor oxidoreductase gamma subunit (pyruvate/2-ketoisovalerate family)
MDFRTIRLRCQIQKPDHVVILDPTLIPVVDVTAGLRPSGWILISHQRGPEAFTEYDAKGWKVATVDAATIALDHKLGSATNPIVNTAILGAFARITRLVSLDSVLRAIQEGVPQRPEANCQAARDAYRSVRAGAALSVEAS